jgi:hypothetical protein
MLRWWSHHGAPRSRGLYLLLLQEGISWFRPSPRVATASPAQALGCGPPTPAKRWAGPSGRPRGATAGSRRARPCSSACGSFCTATPRAATCPPARADGSRRRPTGQPRLGSQGASLTSSWRAAAALGRAPRWTPCGSLASAHCSSRAQEVPCPPGPAAIGDPPTPRGGAHPLPRGPALAQRAQSWPAMHAVDGAPCTSLAGGATGQDAAAPELSVPDHTPASPAAAARTARDEVNFMPFGQEPTAYTSYKVADMRLKCSTSMPRTPRRPGDGHGLLGAPLQVVPPEGTPRPGTPGDRRGTSKTPTPPGSIAMARWTILSSNAGIPIGP